MPDFDPYQLSRPAMRVETRTFVDPAHPKSPLTLTLAAVDEAPSKLRVYKRIADNQADYIDGRPDLDAKILPGMPPPRLPVTPIKFRKDGSQIILDAGTCRFISILQMLEVRGADEGGNPKPEMSIEYWAAVSVTLPSAFMDAGLWANEFLENLISDNDPADPENPTKAHTAD